MFRIIKAGAGIGLTENLNYLKKAENGCYILCPEHDASGIVFEGVAYHLLGRAAMDELETVSLEETDAGTEITKATEAGGIVFVTLAEAGSIDPTTVAEHADLSADWAFPVGPVSGMMYRPSRESCCLPMPSSPKQSQLQAVMMPFSTVSSTWL